MFMICKNIQGRYFFKNLKYSGYISVTAGHSHRIAHPTAGVIVIGDEILKAQVKDVNSSYICSLLYDCGVQVKKVSVVSDEIQQIAEEVVDFSQKYTYVVTTGGIGPTHDDVTFEALAKAFDDSLHYHPTLVEVVKAFSSSQDISSPGYKLAYIPASACLRFGISKETGQRLSYPCISLKNVHVFPGTPMFLQKSFGSLYKELFLTSCKFITKQLYLNAREELFADALATVAREFPNITFGSYPTLNHSYYQARVTVESDREDETDKALSRFRSMVPQHTVIKYDSEHLTNALKKLELFLSVDEHGPLYKTTLTSLKDLLIQPCTVALYFDGSIETTVLLHLAHITNLQGANVRLQSVYIRGEKPSMEVENFIKETVARYDIQLHTLEGDSKEVIREFAMLRSEIRTLLIGLTVDKQEKYPSHDLTAGESFGNIHTEAVLREWTHEIMWNFMLFKICFDIEEFRVCGATLSQDYCNCQCDGKLYTEIDRCTAFDRVFHPCADGCYHGNSLNDVSIPHPQPAPYTLRAPPFDFRQLHRVFAILPYQVPDASDVSPFINRI